MNLFLKWVAQTQSISKEPSLESISKEPSLENFQVEICHFDARDRESSKVFIPLSEFTEKIVTYSQN